MSKNILFFKTLECGLILFYLMINIFSIVIFPINLILGIICILCLPGYNLLKLLKPNSAPIEKIGLTIIFSIAIDNIIMFFYYIFLYNVAITQENPSFFFDEKLLIIIILFVALFLILFNELKDLRNPKSKDILRESLGKKIKIDIKALFVYIIFILSLVLVIISTFYSSVSNTQLNENLVDYSQTFTFFTRVPLIFYLFLTISISCLIYIIFFTKNRFFILISISAFIYCLWILPYIQIGNYFNNDSYELFKIYTNYIENGIVAESNYAFLIKVYRLTTYRYSSSLFTSILLVSATGVDINIALWYLYPIIFLFTPFLFFVRIIILLPTLLS
ncbi:hypothetical protein LCGC14_1659080 [marine sediment metagenome]|uniref:Uncharacterized protein n=1 Tax=marine sediment metagenome TaxID=412755 RepID=A0A0F9HVD2_9ZZZZ